MEVLRTAIRRPEKDFKERDFYRQIFPIHFILSFDFINLPVLLHYLNYIYIYMLRYMKPR